MDMPVAPPAWDIQALASSLPTSCCVTSGDPAQGTGRALSARLLLLLHTLPVLRAHGETRPQRGRDSLQ